MTRLVSIAVLASAALLSACGTSGRVVPDEFEVVGRAPLTLPPENELSPPRPGEPRAQEINPGRVAFEALFPGAPYKPEPPKSQVERMILSGLYRSDPGIRSNFAQPKVDVVKKRLVLKELIEADEFQHAPDNVSVSRVGRSGS